MHSHVRAGALARSRAPRLLWLAMAGAAASYAIGCSKPADVTEPGALLLRLEMPVGGPMPDELRVWTYDDGGVVFTNARIPSEGALVPAAAPGGTDLGTVLIQPGVSKGQLRLHVRGFQAGGRILDGVARVPSQARTSGIFGLTLETAIPADTDADDVPNLIDDCPAQADPEQTGCPDAGASDDAAATTDSGSADAKSAADGAGGRTQGSGGVEGRGGTQGSGGVQGSGGMQGSGGTQGSGGMKGSGGASASGGSGGTTPDAGASDARAADAQPRDSQVTETAKKSPGATCTGSGECQSGFCVDGVCCLNACNQACEVCGILGVCTTVTKGNDTPECSGTMTCNSRGKCVAN